MGTKAFDFAEAKRIFASTRHEISRVLNEPRFNKKDLFICGGVIGCYFGPVGLSLTLCGLGAASLIQGVRDHDWSKIGYGLAMSYFSLLTVSIHPANLQRPAYFDINALADSVDRRVFHRQNPVLVCKNYTTGLTIPLTRDAGIRLSAKPDGLRWGNAEERRFCVTISRTGKGTVRHIDLYSLPKADAATVAASPPSVRSLHNPLRRKDDRHGRAGAEPAL